jgi:hypothetical protein
MISSTLPTPWRQICDVQGTQDLLRRISTPIEPGDRRYVLTCQAMPPSNFPLPVRLICGPAGSGKTTELGQVWLPRSTEFTVRIDARVRGDRLVHDLWRNHEHMRRSLRDPRAWFVLIDNLDAVAPSRRWDVFPAVALVAHGCMGVVSTTSSAEGEEWLDLSAQITKLGPMSIDRLIEVMDCRIRPHAIDSDVLRYIAYHACGSVGRAIQILRDAIGASSINGISHVERHHVDHARALTPRPDGSVANDTCAG